MWKWSPKTPHTQFLCRVQFHKLPLKTYRDYDCAVVCDIICLDRSFLDHCQFFWEFFPYNFFIISQFFRNFFVFWNIFRKVNKKIINYSSDSSLIREWSREILFEFFPAFFEVPIKFAIIFRNYRKIEKSSQFSQFSKFLSQNSPIKSSLKVK